MAPRVISVFRSSEAVDGATYHEAEDYAVIPTDVDVDVATSRRVVNPMPWCDGM